MNILNISIFFHASIFYNFFIQMNFFIFINVPVFLIAFLVLPQPNGAQWSDESIPLGMAWSVSKFVVDMMNYI